MNCLASSPCVLAVGGTTLVGNPLAGTIHSEAVGTAVPGFTVMESANCSTSRHGSSELKCLRGSGPASAVAVCA